MYTGTHDGATLYSTISFNVDEFKFHKIMKNVCYTSTNQKLHDLNGEMDDEHGWWDMRETEDSELS